MKKKIHFILPAGGIRGSFQAGFLHDLFTNYKNTFDVYRIDGTSVGSINGIMTLLEEFSILKETWFDIEKITDFFSKWSNFPIIGSLQNLYYGFWNKGVFNNQLLNNKLKKNLLEILKNKSAELLDKYSCVVTNVTNGQLEYIKGSNPNILEYVTASASPWIITNPKEIDDILYTDGALLETYPIKYVEESDADLIVIVGFDQEVVQFKKPDVSNLLYYLAALLDISRFHSANSIKIKELIKLEKVVPITNTMNAIMTEFKHETIKKGFKQGQEMAHLFYKTYLEEKDGNKISKLIYVIKSEY